jgi:hypothetical protein
MSGGFQFLSLVDTYTDTHYGSIAPKLRLVWRAGHNLLQWLASHWVVWHARAAMHNDANITARLSFS